MNNLIVGYGEVGKAVANILREYHTVSVHDPGVVYDEKIPENVQVMHICFPYSETFVDDVLEYQEIYRPVITIIWSSIAIGTTMRLGPGTVHTPVEGVHPDLADSIRTMDRYVGYNSEADGEFAQNFFSDMSINTKLIPDARITEFLKLRSTSKYGINIAWTDYEAHVMEELGADFKYVQEYDQSYNRLYTALDKPQYQRYILYPPDDGVGGHCLIENAAILDEQFPTPLLKKLLALGKLRSTITEDKPYLNRAWLYAEYWGKERSSEDIGKEFGCTGANILRIMRDRGIRRRTRTWTQAEIQTLINLSPIHTFKEISEEVGKTHDATRLMAIKLGLKSVYDPSNRDEVTRQKISASLQGIALEEWDGFKESVNALIRKSEAMQDWRKAVFERDDYTCQKCGSRGVELHAHHIKGFAQYPELRFDATNGQTLCVPCHEKTDNYKAKGRTKK